MNEQQKQRAEQIVLKFNFTTNGGLANKNAGSEAVALLQELISEQPTSTITFQDVMVKLPGDQVRVRKADLRMALSIKSFMAAHNLRFDANALPAEIAFTWNSLVGTFAEPNPFPYRIEAAPAPPWSKTLFRHLKA